jgi:hypothetical protein
MSEPSIQPSAKSDVPVPSKDDKLTATAITDSTASEPEEAAPPAAKVESAVKTSVWSKLMPAKTVPSQAQAQPQPQPQPQTSDSNLQNSNSDANPSKTTVTPVVPTNAKDSQGEKTSDTIKSKSVTPKPSQTPVTSSGEQEKGAPKVTHLDSDAISKEKINISKDPKGISANDIPKVKTHKVPKAVTPEVTEMESPSNASPPATEVRPNHLVTPSPVVSQAPSIPPTQPSMEPSLVKELKPVIEKIPTEVTLQETTESISEPVASHAEEKFDGSRRTLFIILIASLAILIQVVHMSVTAPLSPGHTLSPNAFMSKCGYRALFSSSCEESSLIMNEDGVLTMYGSDGSLKWEMIGSTCKVVSDTCKNGLTVNTDGSLVIGGKRINAAAIYGKPEFSPWPFTVAPKLRLIKGKK